MWFELGLVGRLEFEPWAPHSSSAFCRLGVGKAGLAARGSHGSVGRDAGNDAKHARAFRNLGIYACSCPPSDRVCQEVDDWGYCGLEVGHPERLLLLGQEAFDQLVLPLFSFVSFVGFDQMFSRLALVG